MQAGGRRFDPVWLHQTAPQAPKFVRENINPRAVRSGGARVMSDIVKRRSIRALRVTKVTAARYLHRGSVNGDPGSGQILMPDAW